MKTTEELAREAGFITAHRQLAIENSADIVEIRAVEPTNFSHELETFRRLVIEDYVAGLEPVGEMREFTREGYGMNVEKYIDADITADLPAGTKIYSLEGVKP